MSSKLNWTLFQVVNKSSAELASCYIAYNSLQSLLSIYFYYSIGKNILHCSLRNNNILKVHITCNQWQVPLCDHLSIGGQAVSHQLSSYKSGRKSHSSGKITDKVELWMQKICEVTLGTDQQTKVITTTTKWETSREQQSNFHSQQMTCNIASLDLDILVNAVLILHLQISSDH